MGGSEDTYKKAPKISYLRDEKDFEKFAEYIEENSLTGLNNVSRLRELIELVGYDITVVCEFNYVDRIYRDIYYNYLASKHFTFSRNCKRLSFFRGDHTYEEFFSYEKEISIKLQEDFIGICVLKPINIGKIGRTLLDPEKVHCPHGYVRLTEFKVIILGNEFEIKAFPFSSQDAEVMTCAETTIWEIIEYFGNRYPEYRAVLPSEIMRELESLSQERTLPSKGLTYGRITNILKIFGFYPRLYARKIYPEERELKRIFHYFVESGLPLAVGISSKHRKKTGFHSIVCIGHGEKKQPLETVVREKLGDYPLIDSADLYDQYIVMDDNQVPYKLQSFDKFGKDSGHRVEVFTVPLYKRIFLEATDATSLIKMTLKHENIGFSKFADIIKEQITDQNPLILRMFLTTSRRYRSFRAKNEKKVSMKQFYASFLFPKFVWIGEISTFSDYLNGKILGEIVVDATANLGSRFDSIIMVRYMNHIGYINPDENGHDLNKRLRKGIKDLDLSYPMYHNNLTQTWRDV